MEKLLTVFLRYILFNLARVNQPYLLMRCTRFFLTLTNFWELQKKDYEANPIFKNALLSMKERTKQILESPDSQSFDYIKDAGKIIGDIQILHNGIKIFMGSYYGPLYTSLLQETRGIHEPQEEKAFEIILKKIPNNALMIEAGSFWAYYSIWFAKEIKQAQTYLIEPDKMGLRNGINNFKLNNFKTNPTNYFVGKISDKKTITIDDFILRNKIDFVHILHADIQGAELDMLTGSKNSLSKSKIGFLFISTHSNELHKSCSEYIQNFNYEIIFSADLDQSYSWDGILIAQSREFFPRVDLNSISIRK